MSTKSLTKLGVVTIEGEGYTTYRNQRGEEVMLDLDIAKVLELADPHKIRPLIVKYRNELGEVSARRAETSSPTGGRPGLACYLTEEQALFIAAKCRTKAATAQLKRLIAVYMAARQGNGAAAVAMAQGNGDSPAEVLEEVKVPRLMLNELVAELRAGREESQANREERRATLNLIMQVTQRLAGPQQPVPALAPVPAEPAAAAQAQPSESPAAVRMRQLRKIKAEKRAAQAAAAASQPAPAERPAKRDSRRGAVVHFVMGYCKALGFSQGQVTDLWRAIYATFATEIGYDPRLGKGKGQRAIDVVQERGDLDSLEHIARRHCPTEKLIESAKQATAAEKSPKSPQLSLVGHA